MNIRLLAIALVVERTSSHRHHNVYGFSERRVFVYYKEGKVTIAHSVTQAHHTTLTA